MGERVWSEIKFPDGLFFFSVIPASFRHHSGACTASKNFAKFSLPPTSSYNLKPSAVSLSSSPKSPELIWILDRVRLFRTVGQRRAH